MKFIDYVWPLLAGYADTRSMEHGCRTFDHRSWLAAWRVFKTRRPPVSIFLSLDIFS